jgi:hypothetical protein
MREPTFDDLAKLEPKLSDLLLEAIAEQPGPTWCANAVWYGYGDRPSMRERLSHLVGWERGEPVEPEEVVGPDGMGKPITAAELVLKPLSEFKARPRGAPAESPEERLLKSSDAYDVAYDTIYGALPDCGPECEGQRIFDAATD